MADVIAFLTSKTGAFSAMAALLGMLGAVVGLVGPIVARRRESRGAAAALRISQPQLSDLSRSSNSYELRFEIANAGKTPAVAVAVRLRVLKREPCGATVPTVTEAPLRVNQHRVKLQAGKDLYDVRARTYGPALPPLSFAEAEVEAFVVKLVADKPERYDIRIEVEWYSAKDMSKPTTSEGPAITVEFPARIPGR